GRIEPPFKSVTVLVALKLGAYRSMIVATAPGKYVSPLVVSVTVALVAPFAMTPAGTSTLSASKPSWFVKFGDLVVTAVFRLVMELLKKFVLGFDELLIVVPFTFKLSPVMPRSPSAAMTLTLAFTVPEG